MATMLRSADSAQKHVDVVERHLHLCAQVDGTDSLRQAIVPALNAVREKMSRADAEEMNLKFRHDGILLSDRIVDNGIRDLFERCRQHDRTFPGSHAFPQVFPDKKLTPIIKCPIEAQPAILADLLMRAESLGPEHPVAVVTAELRQRGLRLKAAIEDWERQKEVVAEAGTALDLALETLRWQYSENFHSAVIRLGAAFADGLFPRNHVPAKRLQPIAPEVPFPQPVTA